MESMKTIAESIRLVSIQIPGTTFYLSPAATMGIADPSRSFVGSTIPAVAASHMPFLIAVDNADEGGSASVPPAEFPSSATSPSIQLW